MGNAALFVMLHSAYARYATDRGWVLFDGKRWNSDKNNQVLSLAKQTVKHISEPDWRKKAQSLARLRAMVALAQPELTIDGTQFDSDPWLLNCYNGIVDLRTGKLLPHCATRLITKFISLDFNDKAVAPLWHSFLAEILPDEALRSYVQRAVGYSLTGRTDEQCLFFCLGNGRNGKSVFLETLIAVAGGYGLNTPTRTVMKKSGGIPNDVARLNGSRIVTLNETGQDQTFDEPLLKDLTGSDTVTARFLFKEYFDFKPAFKLWFRGNHQPLVKGNDDGVWRRFHVIPFDVQIPVAEMDRQLCEKLKSELPGILAWAVRGASDWMGNGLNPPKVVTEAVKQYRRESDVIGQFIDAHCELSGENRIQATLLYEAFKAFAKQNGEKCISQTLFGRSLSSRGFEKMHSNVVYRCGLTLK